jgi:hypothetical protein
VAAASASFAIAASSGAAVIAMASYSPVVTW